MALSSEQKGALCARWPTICNRNLGQSNDLKIANWWGHAIFWLSCKNHSFSPDFDYIFVVSFGINLGHLFKFLLCFWNLFLRIQYAISCHVVVRTSVLLFYLLMPYFFTSPEGSYWSATCAYSCSHRILETVGWRCEHLQEPNIFNLDSRIFCFVPVFFFFLLFHSLMVFSICL